MRSCARASGPKTRRSAILRIAHDSAIAFEDLSRKITRIRTKPPLVHAPVRAEREPLLRDLQIAPAA